GVVTLMLFPFAGRGHYLASRPPSFVAAVLFMPLFAAIAVTLQSDWTEATKSSTLVVLFVGFWGSAAWLVRTPTAGSYVPGLDFGPGLNFRPDLILPGGVMLVKGLVLTGIGMMIAFQEVFRLPRWSWWGFVVAFVGIFTIIPIRGMAKMLARRERFLGNDPRWQVPVRWALLVGGLAVLLYGFLAAFMGRTPFVDFAPRADVAWLTVVLVGGSALSLAVREVWKRRLLEGTESTGQRFVSNLWLYGSVLAYMYGFVVLFMGRYMYPHPGTNPWGVVFGAALFTAGLSLIVGFRPFALRNELLGTINIMVGMLAAMEREDRGRMMTGRIRTIAAYPTSQCAWHVGQMFHALQSLPAEHRVRVEEARNEVIMSLSGTERRALMVAMDQIGAT
ncbi:MAG: hypothetical protein V3U50_01000, partial [Acidimicrobiia bacterium]